MAVSEAAAWRSAGGRGRIPPGGAGRAWLLAALAGTLTLGVGAAFINLVERHRAEGARAAVLETATTHAQRLAGRLEQALSTTDVLGEALRKSSGGDGLEAVAAALLGTHRTVTSLALAPAGVVVRAYPSESMPERLRGDLRRDLATQVIVEEAVRGRQLRVLAPVVSRRDGPQIVGFLPVFLPQADGGERVWGVVLASVGIRALLHESGLELLPEHGYHYHLATTSQTGRRPVVIARSTELDLVDPIGVDVPVPGGTWLLTLSPRANWQARSFLLTEIILVVVAATIVGLSTYRLTREPERLRREVEVRRRRFSEIQGELQAEVVQRRKVEERLSHEAAHDSLTGVPNRASFSAQVQGALDCIVDKAGIAVLFADLDRFKHVNDGLGHAMGDRLLVEAATRLRGCLRQEDVIARVGGDEFAILVGDVRDQTPLETVADRLLKAFELPFALGEREVFVSISIGIAVSTAQSRSADELIRDAETATHRAKALGRARYEIFNAAMRSRVVALIQIESELRRAIERREFVVHYQPVVSLDTGRINGVEALVRWNHPTRGLVPPMQFIPVAEETGLIAWIDRWVLAAGCVQVQAWHTQFPDQELTLSANLSGRQLAQPDLVAHVMQVVSDTGFDPKQLKLEVTESVVVENAEMALDILKHLKALGVRLLIDDFGTGYSSLSYLERFPFDGVKIDQAFVKRMHLQSKDAEIVRTITRLAHTLGAEVIAEGIETAEQLAGIREIGCDYGQGYLFSRPVAADAMLKLLVDRPHW